MAPNLIPEDWLAAAGFVNLPSDCLSYHYDPNLKNLHLVAMDLISPPMRSIGVTGLDKDRSINILKKIYNEQILDPIVCRNILQSENYTLKVKDGYHRYHLSRMLGFSEIPALIYPAFEFEVGSEEVG